MKNLKYYIVVFLIGTIQIAVSQTRETVEPFNKVIISPHIETTFVQGEEESVSIEESTVTEDKINIEVKANTLRVYLEDAREITKTKTVIKNGVKMKVPIYKGKVLTVIITYKKINNLSIRGEQVTLCESKIEEEEFLLKIYGESQVVFNAVNFENMNTTIYGESNLEIKKGNIENQKIIAHGEGLINLINVDNKTTKLTAYGEAEFNIQASKRIKFTAYGEAKLNYKGNATIAKGLIIGDAEISQID